MNEILFNQPGGFPLDTNILNDIHQNYKMLQAIGNCMGNLAILSGCEVAGTNVADGIVYINGEVLTFKGGAVSPNVSIIPTPETRVFEDGATREVIQRRVATFGTSSVNYPWADFKRIAKTLPQLAAEKAEKTALDELIKEVAELKKKTAVFGVDGGGGMVLWNKPANLIPPGWQEVTDWKGKMPVGWDANDVDFNKIRDSVGGQKKVTLAEAQMPIHAHGQKDSYLFESGADWSRVVIGGGIERVETGPKGGKGNGSSDDDNKYVYYRNITTASAGDSLPHDNMPPYRVVMFIEYVG